MQCIVALNKKSGCIEKCAYYVNKLRQNVGLETGLWRHFVTSQAAHTKYKWLPYAAEWNLPHEKFLRKPLFPPGKISSDAHTHKHVKWHQILWKIALYFTIWQYCSTAPIR